MQTFSNTVDVRLTEGHNFAAVGVPPFNLSVELVDPSGVKNYLNKTGEDALYWHSSFNTDKLGMYAILGLHVDEPSYRVYTGPGSVLNNPNANYTWLNDPVDWNTINKTNWADDWHVTRYTTPYKYSKAFMSTNCNFYGSDKSFNQRLEIIPLNDIAAVGKGDFEFKVLWNGKPLPNATIRITATKDINTIVNAIVDGEGKATLPIGGGNWLITASAVDDSALWDGTSNVQFPHGINYTGPGAFVGKSHTAALTLMGLKESKTITMRSKIRPEILFSITPAYLDFGELDPGDISAPKDVIVQNMGSKNLKITVEATDTNGLYTRGLYINSSLWDKFEKEIQKDSHAPISTELRVPQDFSGSGEMKGMLIFWTEAE